MVNHEGLIKHLTVAGNGPFGLLSQQALSTDGLLFNMFGERLAALFSAEHGWFGLAAPGERTGHETHPYWHIPVHSLYGETRRPTPEMLQGLERIVIDLQDIGVRCYTYLATLKNMLEAAAEAHLPVTVLDRPIPLGGVLDGPLRELAYSSFVAPLNVPLCHGMTPGECARYIARAESLELDLTVIKMKDWSHHSRAPWANFTPPSPGIRSWDSAALYPATVFTEAYPALDCDRGGPLSFRIVGAPWLDVATTLNDLAEVLPACGIRALRRTDSGRHPALHRQSRRVLSRHGRHDHVRRHPATPSRRDPREFPSGMVRQTLRLGEGAQGVPRHRAERAIPAVDRRAGRISRRQSRSLQLKS